MAENYNRKETSNGPKKLNQNGGTGIEMIVDMGSHVIMNPPDNEIIENKNFASKQQYHDVKGISILGDIGEAAERQSE